jgi:hypothetical protein
MELNSTSPVHKRKSRGKEASDAFGTMQEEETYYYLGWKAWH